MRLIPVKTRICKKNEDIISFFTQHFSLSSVPENSVIVISSKVLALSQGRVSKKNIAEVAQEEADEILHRIGDFFCTVKDGIVIANSGVDASNSTPGEVILWPKNAWQEAMVFKKHIQESCGIQNIGVVISDSRVTMRRRGTVGVALAWSGIWGVKDERGKKDLYDRPLEVSTVNIADNIVSAAEILMGQADESTPFVVVQDLPSSVFTSQEQPPSVAVIAKEEDLFPRSEGC